jgi:hypothetical protein
MKIEGMQRIWLSEVINNQIADYRQSYTKLHTVKVEREGRTTSTSLLSLLRNQHDKGRRSKDQEL